jgi:tetratricopeptide (TPR) repeat protein
MRGVGMRPKDTHVSKRNEPTSLREVIGQSQLTTQQLIARVGCTRRSLSSWRAGRRPSDYYISRLSEALGVDIWALYKDRQITDRVATASAIEQLSARPALALGLLDNAVLSDTYSGGLSDLRGTPQTIDNPMREYISFQMRSLWDRFHLAQEETSVYSLRAALDGHNQTLHTFASWSLSREGADWLTRALCEAAILDGRIARDQLNYAAAIAFHKRALALALDIEDSAAVVASTMRLAETLVEAGLPYEALSYCNAGLHYEARPNTRIRGELMGFASEVHGILGYRAESERLVNEAAELAIGAVQLSTSGGINFCETAAAEYLAGQALRAGKSANAIAHIERALSLMPTEFPGHENRRWQAHLYIDQARVYVHARELNEACASLRRATRIALEIGSRITMRKVQDATREIEQQSGSIPALLSLQDEILERTEVMPRIPK